MKAILVIDVPMLDDGRHLCNECPIWNKERLFCEYDVNMETKRCPLRPMPKKMEASRMETPNDCDYRMGWNDCIEEIENESKKCV